MSGYYGWEAGEGPGGDGSWAAALRSLEQELGLAAPSRYFENVHALVRCAVGAGALRSLDGGGAWDGPRPPAAHAPLAPRSVAIPTATRRWRRAWAESCAQHSRW